MRGQRIRPVGTCYVGPGSASAAVLLGHGLSVLARCRIPGRWKSRSRQSYERAGRIV